MSGENNYFILKQMGILMALDITGIIAETAVTFTSSVLLDIASSGETVLPISILSEAHVYTSWTVWMLRLLVWSLALVSLSRLTQLRKSFEKARIWYLLRILAFIAVCLTTVAVNHSYHNSILSPQSRVTVAATFMFIIGMNVLGDMWFLSMASRATLLAGAELLESFGLEASAQKNRRCGNRLNRFVVAQICSLVFAVALAAGIWLVREGFLFHKERGAVLGLSLTVILLVLCACFMGLGIMVLRVLAALRIHQTYRAFRELTQ